VNGYAGHVQVIRQALSPDGTPVHSRGATHWARLIELMQAGAAYLKQAINTLGWQPGEPLCLIGGLGRFYTPFLPDQMVQSVTPPKGTALDGALHLAERLAARQRRAEP